MKMKLVVVATWLSTLALTRFFGLQLLWLMLFPAFFFLNRYGERHELPNVLRVFLASSSGILLINSNILDLTVGTLCFILSIWLNDEPMRHVWHNRGVIVLAGSDGSGKSTFAKHISEWLDARGFKCRIVKFSDYMFLNQLVTLKSPSLWRTRRLVTDSAADRSPPHAKKSKISFMRPYMAFLDNLLKYLVKVVPAVWKDEFVVCDRFIWNAYVKHAGLGYRTRFLFGLSTVIKPKCGLLLDAPFNVVAKRIVDRYYYHPQYGLEEYKLEKTAFEKLAKKLDYATVDTDKPLEQVKSEVIMQVSRLSPKIRKEVLGIAG